MAVTYTVENHQIYLTHSYYSHTTDTIGASILGFGVAFDLPIKRQGIYKGLTNMDF